MEEENFEQAVGKNITIDERIADGVYSNLPIVSNSDTEFVIDFASIMPGSPNAKVLSRVIISPTTAKRLLEILSDNLEKFEEHDFDNQDVSMPFYGEQAKA